MSQPDTPNPPIPGVVPPTPAALRVWIAAALVDLNLAASRVAPAVGMSKNVLTEFMRDPGRDLKLSTAARLHRWLEAEAARQGKSLQPLEPGKIA